MLSTTHYFCEGSNSPAEAVYACIQPHCRHHALTCGRRGCQCMPAHFDHNMMQFESILLKSGSPPALSQSLSKLEKTVQQMLGRLAKDVQLLQQKHRAHINQHLEKSLGGSSLRSRLRNRQEVQGQELTGDRMYRLTQELNKAMVEESPYGLSMDELKKQCMSINEQFSQLLSKSQNLWKKEIPTPYHLSDKLHHKAITLSADAKQASTGNEGAAVVIVEPALNLSTVNSVTFKVPDPSSVLLGVCYGNIACGQSNGTYGMWVNDGLRSYSRKEDVCKKFVSPKLKQNDSITLTLDPATGRLVYSSEGQQPLVQETSIRQSAQQVYFCVVLNSQRSVRLV